MPSLLYYTVNRLLVSFSQHCFSFFWATSVDLMCPPHTHTRACAHPCTEFALQSPGGQENLIPFVSFSTAWQAEGQTQGGHFKHIYLIYTEQDQLKLCCYPCVYTGRLWVKTNCYGQPGNFIRLFPSIRPSCKEPMTPNQTLDSGPSKGWTKWVGRGCGMSGV